MAEAAELRRLRAAELFADRAAESAGRERAEAEVRRLHILVDARTARIAELQAELAGLRGAPEQAYKPTTLVTLGMLAELAETAKHEQRRRHPFSACASYNTTPLQAAIDKRLGQ